MRVNPLSRINKIVILVLMLAFSSAAWAQFQLGAPKQDANFPSRSKILTRTLPQHTQIAPGNTLNLLIEVRIAPGWHLQSAHPLEPRFKALLLTPKSQDDITVEEILYPQHMLIDAGNLSSQKYLAVYEKTIYLLAKFKIAPGAAAGERTLEATLRTQACDDNSCLFPVTTPLTATFNIAPGDAKTNPDAADLFASQAVADLLANPLSMSPATTSPAPQQQPAAEAQAAPADSSELALLASRSYQPADSDQAELPLWQLILFALIGGMILNIMPCVLPVIPLKAIQLIQQAHGDRKRAVMHGLVFSAGVITLFAILALVLTTAFSGTVVYGKQFQNAGFVITMAMIILSLALSMLGVWTINPPQAVYQAEGPKSGYAGSFFMGLLATLLATPCSAPLLGSVLAWALIQPKMITLLMFILVGVGMSLPYILLTAFPSAIDKLPRAGRWAELLKQALGIVMIGVTIWLLIQLPPAILPWALFGAIILGFVCWAWGQLPNPTGSRSHIWGMRSAAIGIGLCLTGALFYLAKPVADTATEQKWQPLSIKLIDDALAAGRPVVVDWGADWCWNCIVLEKTVLSAEDVQKHFADKNTLLLKADLSHSNPLGEDLLARLNTRAIPALAIFSPKDPLRPVVLRDGYTRQRVKDELAKAAR